jgi:hypothetical protein
MSVPVPAADRMTDGQRGTGGGRGPAAGEVPDESWLRWCGDILWQGTVFAAGLEQGVLWGAPIYNEMGQIIGRHPGLIPENREKGMSRAGNQALAGLGIPILLYGEDFIKGVFWGLWNELKGLWDLLWALLDGSLFQAITQSWAKLMQDTRTAFFLGQDVGGGMVKDLAIAAEGPFDKFVYKLGELLGMLLPDIIAAFVSGGGLTMLREGARVATTAGKQAVDMLGTLGRRAGNRLDEATAMLEKARRASDPVPEYALAPAGRGVGGYGARGFDPEGFGKAPYTVYNMPDGATAPRPGGPRTGGGVQKPQVTTPSASAPSGAGLSAPRAAVGGLASEAATVSGKHAARSQMDELNELGRLARHAAQVGADRPSAEILMRGPDLGKLTQPEVDAVLSAARLGRRLPDPELTDFIRAMNQFAGVGGIDKASLFIVKGSRAIATHVGAVVHPRLKPRDWFPNYNSRAPWPSLISDHNRVMAVLARDNPGLAAKMNAMHSFGPGMGDETMLGMGLGPDWINRKVQAGGFSNRELGVASRRDARTLQDPDTPRNYFDEIENRAGRKDEVGMEGLVIDYALSMREATRGLSGSAAQNVRVYLDVFTESFGDELLDTVFFREARRQGLAIKPQHFLREVQYQMRTFVVEGGEMIDGYHIGGNVKELAGGRMAFDLEIAPPHLPSEAKINIFENGSLTGTPTESLFLQSD